MKIKYWDCEYKDYSETWDGVEECRCYGCTHDKGTGICELHNKYRYDEDDCELLDIRSTKK